MRKLVGQEFREAKPRQPTKALPDFMVLIGAVNMKSPESLPSRAQASVRALVRNFMWTIRDAEHREAQGLETTRRRMDVIALAFALRVLLRPEIQDIVREESERDE